MGRVFNFSGSSLKMTNDDNGNIIIEGDINNAVITPGKIIADGVEYNISPGANITIKGSVNQISTSSVNINVTGMVGNIKSASGDITCGDVSGSVSSASGDIKCGNILGSCSTMTGDIIHK